MGQEEPIYWLEILKTCQDRDIHAPYRSVKNIADILDKLWLSMFSFHNSKINLIENYNIFDPKLRISYYTEWFSWKVYPFGERVSTPMDLNIVNGV